MATFDRFDICEAYHVLEADYNVNGVLWERVSNRRRMESIGAQLSRMEFRSPMLRSYEDLTENGQEIYDAAVERMELGSVHLTLPRGGNTCGESTGRSTSDINIATCGECVKQHDKRCEE